MEMEMEERINVDNTKPRDTSADHKIDDPKGSMIDECWQSIKSHPLETGLAAASMAALAIVSRGKVLPRLLIEEAEAVAKAPATLKLVHSAPNALTSNTKTAFALRLASKDGQLASGFHPTLNLGRTSEQAKPASKLADWLQKLNQERLHKASTQPQFIKADLQPGEAAVGKGSFREYGFTHKLDPVDAKTTPDIWLRMGLNERGEFFLNPLTKTRDLHLKTFEVKPQASSLLSEQPLKTGTTYFPFRNTEPNSHRILEIRLGEMTGVHKPRSTYLEDQAYLLIRPETKGSKNFLSIFSYRNYLGDLPR